MFVSLGSDIVVKLVIFRPFLLRLLGFGVPMYSLTLYMSMICLCFLLIDLCCFIVCYIMNHMKLLCLAIMSVHIYLVFFSILYIVYLYIYLLFYSFIFSVIYIYRGVAACGALVKAAHRPARLFCSRNATILLLFPSDFKSSTVLLQNTKDVVNKLRYFNVFHIIV